SVLLRHRGLSYHTHPYRTHLYHNSPYGAVEPDGHRPIVEQGHIHVRAEAPGLDADALLAQKLGAPVHQRLGKLWWVGVNEGRPAAFARVGVQGELRHEQDRASYVL